MLGTPSNPTAEERNWSFPAKPAHQRLPEQEEKSPPSQELTGSPSAQRRDKASSPQASLGWQTSFAFEPVTEAEKENSR